MSSSLFSLCHTFLRGPGTNRATHCSSTCLLSLRGCMASCCVEHDLSSGFSMLAASPHSTPLITTTPFFCASTTSFTLASARGTTVSGKSA